jgi:hypothetical protein
MSTQAVSIDSVVQYSSTDHRFFDELVRLIICFASVGQSFELHKAGEVKPFNPNETIVIEGKQGISGLEIHFFPRPLFDKFLSPSSKSIRFLKVIKRPINTSPPNHPLKMTKVQRIMSRLIGDAFVSYYERHVEQVNLRYGKLKDGRWPKVWLFARAMRNACAHNGRIHITNSNDEPVEWRTLKYGFSDNEKEVLFGEITGVELILLMEEMDILF